MSSISHYKTPTMLPAIAQLPSCLNDQTGNRQTISPRISILFVVTIALFTLTLGLFMLEGCADNFPLQADTVLVFHHYNSDSAGWVTSKQDTTKTLYVVNFTTPQLGVVAGDSGCVSLSVDGGTNWTSLASPMKNALYCAHFFTPSIGIVAGNDMNVYHTTDDGVNWTAIPVAPDNNYSFRGLYFIDTAIGFLSAGGFSGSRGQLYKTTDAGLSWTLNFDNPFGSLYGITFYDQQNGIVTGASHIVMVTTDQGATWTNSYTPAGDVIMTPVYLTPDVIIAACYSDSISGSYIRSTDGGASWDQSSTFSYGLQAIAATPFKTTMAGYGGHVLTSTDYGVTWTPTKLPYARIVSATNVGMNRIFLVGSLGNITHRDEY